MYANGVGRKEDVFATVDPNHDPIIRDASVAERALKQQECDLKQQERDLKQNARKATERTRSKETLWRKLLQKRERLLAELAALDGDVTTIEHIRPKPNVIDARKKPADPEPNVAHPEPNVAHPEPNVAHPEPRKRSHVNVVGAAKDNPSPMNKEFDMHKRHRHDPSSANVDPKCDVKYDNENVVETDVWNDVGDDGEDDGEIIDLASLTGIPKSLLKPERSDAENQTRFGADLPLGGNREEAEKKGSDGSETKAPNPTRKASPETKLRGDAHQPAPAAAGKKTPKTKPCYSFKRRIPPNARSPFGSFFGGGGHTSFNQTHSGGTYFTSHAASNGGGGGSSGASSFSRTSSFSSTASFSSAPFHPFHRFPFAFVTPPSVSTRFSAPYAAPSFFRAAGGTPHSDKERQDAVDMLRRTRDAGERLCFAPFSTESREKATIFRHYRILALLVHPDKFKGADIARAQEAFQNLAAAKDALLLQAV